MNIRTRTTTIVTTVWAARLIRNDRRPTDSPLAYHRPSRLQPSPARSSSTDTGPPGEPSAPATYGYFLTRRRRPTSIPTAAPVPHTLITFPNGVSASNVRNFAPGGNVVMTTVTKRAAPNEELVDWISRNVDTGVALVLSVGAMKVAANCPFAFVVPVDGVTLPAPDVRVMLMDAPTTGTPFESRTVTVIGALPPEPTADGMLAADRIAPGGAGSSKIRDQ